MFKTKDQREIRRKLRILQYAEEIGHVTKTCRYFGIGRASFYRWRKAYAERGEAGLINAPPIPKWHANRTPPEREEKVLYLRRKYHLGPMRIVWHLGRYHDIKMSDATVSRSLRRYGLTRLPRGTRMRRVQTKRYQKQVPGHHIQMDVKFLTFIGKKGEKVRRFEYTAIDDATRARALKVYEKTPKPMRPTSLTTSLKNSRSASGRLGQITATNSRPSSTGTLKTMVSATQTSNAARRSRTARWNDHTGQTGKSFTCAATKAMLIWKPNWTNGRGSTISTDRTAHTTERRLTKHSEKNYNQQIGSLTSNRTLQSFRALTPKQFACEFGCLFSAAVPANCHVICRIN